MRILDLVEPTGQEGHCAFTDLCAWQDALWCVWRQASAHVSNDGKLVLVSSDDGRHWHPTAVLSLPGSDLRDPRLMVQSDGALWLLACAATPRGQGRQHQNHLWRSRDGRRWQHQGEVGRVNHWLWGWTRRGDTQLALAYHCTAQRCLSLYSADADGQFHHLRDLPESINRASESALHLGPDLALHVLLRRDPDPGLLLRSPYPWTCWDHQTLKQRLAAPQWLVDDDGGFISCFRVYQPEERVALFSGKIGSPTCREQLALPGEGDCGYAGMTRWRGALWVSYYHSATGASRVYLAAISEDAVDTSQPAPYDDCSDQPDDHR